MIEDMEYQKTLKQTRERFDAAVGAARVSDFSNPDKWEEEAERDLELLLQFSTDKIKALYNLFLTVDQFVINQKIQLQQFRHEPPSIDELREISWAVSEFYEEFLDTEQMIEELKHRAKNFKRKEKK